MKRKMYDDLLRWKKALRRKPRLADVLREFNKDTVG